MAVSQTSYNACLWINDFLSKTKILNSLKKKKDTYLTMKETFFRNYCKKYFSRDSNFDMLLTQFVTWNAYGKEILVGQTFGSTPEYMSFDCRYWKDITIWHILANRKRLTGDTAKNRFIIFCVISTFDLLETLCQNDCESYFSFFLFA